MSDFEPQEPHVISIGKGSRVEETPVFLYPSTSLPVFEVST